MNEEWETYIITITTPEDESKEAYADKESDRGDLTDQFETELFKLIAKYNSYANGAGKIGLKIEARNSLDEPIKQY